MSPWLRFLNVDECWSVFMFMVVLAFAVLWPDIATLSSLSRKSSNGEKSFILVALCLLWFIAMFEIGEAGAAVAVMERRPRVVMMFTGWSKTGYKWLESGVCVKVLGLRFMKAVCFE